MIWCGLAAPHNQPIHTGFECFGHRHCLFNQINFRMKIHYQVKHWLKLRRWQYRRFFASQQWGADWLKRSPIVFGNAMPKSGSHLIFQVLQGMTKIGAFVNPGFPPVNRGEDNSKLAESMIFKNIQRLQAGDIAYGYIHAREPFTSYLCSEGLATIFVYRDPRDMIVSHIFYATQIHQNHGMHRFYTETLSSMDERIRAAILGVKLPGSELSSIRAKYENYLAWLEQPDVLCLRFEELIGNRNNAINRLLDYLVKRGFTESLPRERSISCLIATINPKKSGTFRKAKPGNWREYFSPENVTLFKHVTGDLLQQLGYQENNDW